MRTKLKPIHETIETDPMQNRGPIVGYYEKSHGVIIHYRDPEGTIIHRTDGPAMINTNTGDEYWYRNGKRHRDGDRPAIDGKIVKAWLIDGKRHRDSGPAIRNYQTGYEAYYQNDRLHRVGGPAVTYENGDYAYYYNGVFIVGVKDSGMFCNDLHTWNNYRHTVAVKWREENESLTET